VNFDSEVRAMTAAVSVEFARKYTAAEIATATTVIVRSAGGVFPPTSP
jgi:hypothetical protein